MKHDWEIFSEVPNLCNSDSDHEIRVLYEYSSKHTRLSATEQCCVITYATMTRGRGLTMTDLVLHTVLHGQKTIICLHSNF